LLDAKLSWRRGLRAIQDLERWLPTPKGAAR
jgi:hypothetical protein